MKNLVTRSTSAGKAVTRRLQGEKRPSTQLEMTDRERSERMCSHQQSSNSGEGRARQETGWAW